MKEREVERHSGGRLFFALIKSLSETSTLRAGFSFSLYLFLAFFWKKI